MVTSCGTFVETIFLTDDMIDEVYRAHISFRFVAKLGIFAKSKCHFGKKMVLIASFY